MVAVGCSEIEVNFSAAPHKEGSLESKSSRKEENKAFWSQRRNTRGSLHLMQHSGYLRKLRSLSANRNALWSR